MNNRKNTTAPMQKFSGLERISAVNAIALPRLENLCREWLHGGRRENREYVALNPVRAPKNLSGFRVNLVTDHWADFATGVRRWKGSDGGLEAATVLANDAFQALDEIGQADPKMVGDLIYLLANGVGKKRAGVRGRALKTARWSCCIL